MSYKVSLLKMMNLMKLAFTCKLSGIQSWRLVLASCGSTLLFVYVYDQLTQPEPVLFRWKKKIYRWIRPFFKAEIDSKSNAIRKSVQSKFLEDVKDFEEVVVLPLEGWSHDKVVEYAKSCFENVWSGGCLSGTVYNGSVELTAMVTKIFEMTVWSNPLHAESFPGIRKMEAEVVRMVCEMFHGGLNSCGLMTSGGTESIILACKAYRDMAIETKGISKPVMVVPVTAHAAFDKAASLLGMYVRHVEVDPVTCRVSISAMKRAICRQTCMLVGSAPQFPHGTIDDIEAISNLGLSYGIPVHVDCCLGGFLLPFMQEAGYSLNISFDFSLPGVTSISADTHKYAFTPKGSSVLVYSDPKFRFFQWFSVPDWPGGIYATPSIGGSRPGALIACCWASMIHFGKSGYVRSTRSIIKTTRYIAKRLEEIEGLKIVGIPEVCVVAFTSDTFSIYTLYDRMMKLHGWNLNPLQFPTCIHLCVTLLHTQDGVADKFIHDLESVSRTLIEESMSNSKNPEEEGVAAIYGVSQLIPDRSVVSHLARVYLDSTYVTKSIFNSED